MLLRCQEHRLPEATPIRPAYAEKFRCIGPACEDICCQGWSVPIDQAAYEKYQQLPASPLRTLIDANILRMPESGATSAEDVKPGIFAKIRMDSSNQCPMLTEERLCRIQVELGEALLSYSCATYPRVVHSVGGMEEKPLTLSCPEAARLVLMSPDLLSPDPPSHDLPNADPATRMEKAGVEATSGEDEGTLPPHFWAIRDYDL
jgi:lysine-N-methylase